jgi:hypothetical protein
MTTYDIIKAAIPNADDQTCDFVSVEYLGEAKDENYKGVICASFNAG